MGWLNLEPIFDGCEIEESKKVQFLVRNLGFVALQLCVSLIFYIMRARVELFNGKGSLIQGLIQSVDRSGLDFVALEDPKLVLPQNTQWHVFAAFG